MLASISISSIPPSHHRLEALFTLVIMYLASLTFSLLLLKSQLVRLLICIILHSLNAQVHLSKNHTQLFEFGFEILNSGKSRSNQ